MVFVGPFQCRYCWCVGSSQSAGSSTAADRAGCRNYGLSLNTAASQSCSPVSYNCHIDPSGQERRGRGEEKRGGGGERRWRKTCKDKKRKTTTLNIQYGTPLGSMVHNVQCRGTLSLYPIVEYSVLGHAVGSTELLHPASIVAVQHLLADAGAVGAGTPGMILVTRCQVMFKE